MSQIRVLMSERDVEVGGLNGADATRSPRNGFSLVDKVKPTDKVSIFAPLKFIETSLKTPNLNGEELRQAVRFQIENLYPSIHTDLVFDFEKVVNEVTKEESRVQVKAYLVKKSEILSLLSEIGILNAGIVIERISSSGFVDKPLNFLPQDIILANVQNAKNVSLKRLFVVGSISLLGLGFLLLVNGILEVVRVQSIRKNLTNISAAYQKALPIYEGQKEKIKHLREKGLLESVHIFITPSFFTVSKEIREGIYLTRIEREKNGTTLEGRARDESRVIGYIASLNQTLSGEKAELRYSENMGEGNVSFKILLR